MTFALYWWAGGFSVMFAMTHEIMTDDDSWIGRAYRMMYTNTPEYFWIVLIFTAMTLGPLPWIYAFYMWSRNSRP